jgi:glycopeptide antibiotics resistance protein
MSGRSGGLSLRFLWIVFAIFVIYGTTIPFHFVESAAEVRANLARLSPNPFLSPETGRRVSIPDTVQNVLLFLPFGLLGFLTLQPRLQSGSLALAVTTIFGGLLSGGVEALQLLTVDRLSSLSDVVTNTAGAFSGALAAYVLQGAIARVAPQVAARGLNRVPAFQPALVAAVMVMLSAWEPFDFTLDVSTVVGKVRALATDPWQSGLSGDDLATLTRFAIAGLASVVWLRSLRVPRPLAMSLLFGTVTALALEGSQLFVASRMPSGEDALLHVVAVVCGALIGTGWPYGLGTGVWYALLAVATYASIAWLLLFPFRLTSTYTTLGLFPFFSYYARTTFETISHVLELWLAYFPLGYGLGMAIDRPVRRWVLSIGLTLIVAAPLEYMQGWVEGRYPDVTDIGMAIAGAWLGTWLGVQARPHTQLRSARRDG